MEGKRFVPWFSMEEWKSVRGLIYSSGSSNMEKGYRMLQMWKARCPILPVGVECTMEVVKVMLEDKRTRAIEEVPRNISAQTTSLEFVYSSVIMRFLNFVTELKSAEVSTIYRAASELNIPDWIVNIRHDAAHGRIVPPLPLLQSAVEFIFNWLYEKYWADEADTCQGYAVPEEGGIGWKEKLASLIDYYINVNQLCQSGVSTLDQLRTLPEGKILYQKLDENELLQSFQLANTDFVLLTDVRQKLLKRLQRAVEQRSSKNQNDDALVGVSTSETNNMLIGETTGKGSALPRDYLNTWWPILKHLSGSTFYSLMLTLKNISNSDEGNHRAILAALWLSEFFRVIKNSQNSLIETDEETLSSSQIPEHDKLQALAKDICSNPNQMSSHYLPRLLDLLEPRADRKRNKMIIELHNIYSGKKLNNTEEDNVIHSLEDLLLDDPISERMNGGQGNEEEDEEEEVTVVDTGPVGIWNQAQGDFGWSACPLGAVPWQRQHMLSNWSALASI